MTPEEKQAVAYHVRELAKLLYKDAETSQMPMTNLGEIEATVREQVQKHVTPEMGIFYRNSYRHQRRVRATPQKHLGLKLTNEQAKHLGVRKGRQLSPYLEMCCLRINANVSYAHASEDMVLLTDVRVSPKTQQRLVQRQSFDESTIQPVDAVNQVSLDGG